jgi:L-threonylcarbamoyladenylate synthase
VRNGRIETMAVIEASNSAIEAAAQALRDGKLVAFPTETVYGLGADATNGRAVAAIFAAKGRPRFNPLIVHVPDVKAATRLGQLDDLGRRLAAAFWPGALSIVMAKRPDCAVADLATAGLDTIALRVPRHPVAQALLRAAHRPVAAPSANLSGGVSPTTAAHVQADLGDRVAMILDGGATALGLESTVVDVTGEEPVVLRLGGVAREELARVLGRSPRVATGDPSRPASPGMLERHYAPTARLRLGARDASAGEVLLAFGRDVPQHAGPMRNLSASGDLAEAAANLFSALRALDALGAGTIAVMPIPDEGLGEAINDRLRRAARTP